MDENTLYYGDNLDILRLYIIDYPPKTAATFMKVGKNEDEEGIQLTHEGVEEIENLLSRESVC